MSFFARLLFNGLGEEFNLNDQSEVSIAIRGALILYVIILTLSIITFKLGFAKKLPIFKSIIVYAFLALGCIILTVPLGISLPIAEGLLVSTLVLAIYRLRLHRERKERNSVS
ncbi:membrane protein [Pontibacillus litoralis JSM 072002]|uniref:Membrane protein n=1 Tax=Pontibacillus litoralis JSM 072002 TaxID=1385512 RepID=A0A0A5HYT0_9BACI|nr:membrane protein [Pontibacillus litoralis JSM 072002]